MGSAAADSELDALKDAAEAQITASSNLVGHFAGLVATFCYNKYEAHSERALKATASNIGVNCLLTRTAHGRQQSALQACH